MSSRAAAVVTLVNADKAKASFTVANEVSANETLMFQLEVSDGVATHTDTVSITLTPPPPNQAPTLTVIDSASVPENQSFSITATGDRSGRRRPLLVVGIRVGSPRAVLGLRPSRSPPPR